MVRHALFGEVAVGRIVDFFVLLLEAIQIGSCLDSGRQAQQDNRCYFHSAT